MLSISRYASFSSFVSTACFKFMEPDWALPVCHLLWGDINKMTYWRIESPYWERGKVCDEPPLRVFAAGAPGVRGILECLELPIPVVLLQGHRNTAGAGRGPRLLRSARCPAQRGGVGRPRRADADLPVPQGVGQASNCRPARTSASAPGRTRRPGRRRRTIRRSGPSQWRCRADAPPRRG